MTFANPLMLWGLLGALIPVLVHLFDRRRPRPHPFGAISFVLKSQKRTASRLKLKRLLLYTLRTLLLLAIPLALARPQLAQDALAASSARGPAATAIVLDGSLSMRYADGESLFERGREQARQALRELAPEEPASFVLCDDQVSSVESATFDRGRLRGQIDDAQATYASASLNRCLDIAARSLEESVLAGKRIVVISDLSATAFRLDAPAPTVKGPAGEPVRPEVVLRDVAAGQKELPNRAIVDLRIEPALQMGARAYVFTFSVRNFASQPVKDLEASLQLGGKTVAKGFVELGPQGSASKSLTHRFDAGGLVFGRIQLAPDALAEDDAYPFVLNVASELKALVVNGAPNTVRYRDEAFFVEAALGSAGSPVQPSFRDAEAGYKEDFGEYQLVLLLNAPAPTEEVAGRLVDFVEAGGGLFVSMGDLVEPDVYTQRLGPVLPRPLRLVKTASKREDPDGEARAAKLVDVDLRHPVFSPFTGRAQEGLLGSRFYRYMLLEGEAAGGGERGGSAVLATFDDGAPAFAFARRGQGRVLLFTSTVDRDWTDLPIRTSFLPLLQRLSAYLSGTLEEREEIRARVGDTVDLPQAGARPVAEVLGPNDEELPIRPEGDGKVQVGPLRQMGTYRVRDAEEKDLPTLAFAAVLDPSESDLTRVAPEVLSAYFGRERVTTAGGDAPARHVPIWTWLFAFGAVALFLEGVLLRKTG